MRILVCIPTYNERDNIPSLVEEILATTDADVMILDDDSPDGTGQIAELVAQGEPRVKVVHRPRKAGVAKAYKDGFGRAQAEGYDAVFQMDADFSHQPRYLPYMIGALDSADVVVGSRYIAGGGVENWAIPRRVVSRGSNLYARTVLGMPYEDATSGFVGFKKHVLEAIDFPAIDAEAYAFQIELKYRAHRLGFKIVEVPIIFYDRTAGHSKMSRRTVAQAVLRVLELRLREDG